MLALQRGGDASGGRGRWALLPNCFVVALTHSAKVFTKRHHPSVRSCRFIHEAFIAADGFAGDGVNHGHGVVF